MGNPANTIDEVIEQLTHIVESAKADEARFGYFAALYRLVTREVKARIDEGGFFDDDSRMERLDVVFANRYLEAFEQRQQHLPTTQSWAYAFDEADHWWPVVLQHLLLGMNAHINLDLGIAAARVCPGNELASLQADFDRINSLLAEMVGQVQESLTWVWPPLRWLTRGLGTVDDAIINFSMRRARDAAWAVATRLAPLSAERQAIEIANLDASVSHFAQVIRRPGFLLSTVAKVVRIGERGTIREIIQALE